MKIAVHTYIKKVPPHKPPGEASATVTGLTNPLGIIFQVRFNLTATNKIIRETRDKYSRHIYIIHPNFARALLLSFILLIKLFINYIVLYVPPPHYLQQKLSPSPPSPKTIPLHSKRPQRCQHRHGRYGKYVGRLCCISQRHADCQARRSTCGN